VKAAAAAAGQNLLWALLTLRYGAKDATPTGSRAADEPLKTHVNIL
jgi:hypothetical protein